MQIKFADELAARRGSRSFSNNDLIFQLRHDAARVERLQKFLNLKHIRKISKSDDEDNDKTQVEEVDASDSVPDEIGNRRTTTAIERLPWHVSSICPELPPSLGELDTFQEPAIANLEKLRSADRKTLGMTVGEYTTWSEYRHASFTRRRVIRFRRWCGLGSIADHKSNDDVLDILGFLTSEMVQRLTGLALAIQRREMQLRDMKERQHAIDGRLESSFRSNTMARVKPAIEAHHIRQAYETTQADDRTHRIAGKRSWSRTGLRII